LLGDGYPDRSTILVVGPPGIGKQGLGYWFTHFGLIHGDVGLYITRLTIREVLHDIGGFGIDTQQIEPVWLASDSPDVSYDPNNIASLSSSILDFLRKNAGSRIRITIDILSSLLALNSPEVIYRFLTQLFSEIKQYDVVLLATLEDSMHKPEVVATIEQLFDGVVEFRMYEEAMRLLPLLRIAKMRGMLPSPTYYLTSFSKTGVEVNPYTKELGIRAWLRGPR
jgi:KaiC/GvpD/RAD55 family RecA-like ATPase